MHRYETQAAEAHLLVWDGAVGPDGL